MKREELLLGASIYALIILAGFSGPIVHQLKKLGWDGPMSAGIGHFFNPPHSDSPAIKALQAVVVSTASREKTPFRTLSTASGKEPIRRLLKDLKGKNAAGEEPTKG